MTNNKPKPVRQTFTNWYNTAKTNLLVKPSLDAYREGVKLFFRNNVHMCQLAGRSERAHLIEVYRLTGFRVSEPYYSQLKSGQRVAGSPYVYMMIAASWGYTMWDFHFKDLTGVTEVKQVA